jgi:hypothetical protein
MKGFIECMTAWYDFDAKKYRYYIKEKHPDQLELPLDEPKVQEETQAPKRL